MRTAIALLSVAAFIVLLTPGVETEAQIQSSSQESTRQNSGEVDRLVDEVVISTCLENCQTKRATAELTGGEILERSQVEYPMIARMARVSGSVVVLVAVDEEGNVIAAQSVSGHPLLQSAAVKAARETVFTPFMLGGRRVKVKGNLTYNFLIE